VDGNTGGNRATAPGDGEVVAPWGLSPRVALGRGAPGRRPSARKESAATFREAREIKLRRAAEAACDAAGPTLHSYALEWVDHYAGRGANDVINDRTRREYRRLLVKYALA
jgi:hypothetical protein